MIKVFLPNGIGSFSIIKRMAKKEFGERIGDTKNYVELKKDIIRIIKSLSKNDQEENYLSTMVEIKHLEENDFGNFISVRFAFWGMIIAVGVLLIEESPIYTLLNVSRCVFSGVVICALIFILITMSRIIHQQHDRKEYLNYKLICFKEIKHEE